MSNSYRKAKTVAKDILVHGETLEEKVLSTMSTISAVVGATLGPSGRPILIERQEYGLPHIVTKDGVTTFRSLGFNDPTAHAIMEAARDASIRTATEAGDGTSTATVLSEAIVRYSSKYCKANPKASPQKVVRKLEKTFREFIEPKIKSLSIKPNEEMLKSVAKLSTNGDLELANAVMECFEYIGDDGSISITELSGPSHYEVEHISGFPISMGFEESCAKLFPLFINDKANNRCFLEKPSFVLYFGQITNTQTIIKLMEKIADGWANPSNHNLKKAFSPNVVLVATGFSESVLGDLGANFPHGQTINVFPLVTPKTGAQNAELHFLDDLASVTGAKVFDPITNTLENAKLSDLGYGDVQSFEAQRYRSTILGIADEGLIIARAEEVKNALKYAESKMDCYILEERLGKLTGGIAKLKVIGASNGELREKRDRAEDATFAVRGARRHGCLPGGGWTLAQLVKELTNDLDPVIKEVLIPSLLEPIKKLLTNCGLIEEEIEPILQALINTSDHTTYDAMEGKFVNAVEGGILDSTPAVLEAIRNSISIASLLGTLGGTVVFHRDAESEIAEADSTNSFLDSYNKN